MNSVSFCRSIYNLRFNVISKYKRRDFYNVKDIYYTININKIEKKENINLQTIIKDIHVEEIESIKNIINYDNVSKMSEEFVEDLYISKHSKHSKFVNLECLDNIVY